MTWNVEFDDRARKELRKLDRSAQDNILNYLRTKIASDKEPRRYGDPLRMNLSGFWKYRIGAYRVICNIVEHRVTVRIIRIGHRKDIYE